MVQITEIKDEITQDTSIANQLYSYSLTPYPSWLFSTALLSTPFVTKQPISTTSSSGRFLFSKTTHVGPSPISSLLFGSAFALGGWIIHDGDVESGSGFITAWSSLYLIANGRSTFNGLRYGKVWPILLTSIGGVNAYTYGKRFFFTNETSFQ